MIGYCAARNGWVGANTGLTCKWDGRYIDGVSFRRADYVGRQDAMSICPFELQCSPAVLPPDLADRVQSTPCRCQAGRSCLRCHLRLPAHQPGTRRHPSFLQTGHEHFACCLKHNLQIISAQTRRRLLFLLISTTTTDQTSQPAYSSRADFSPFLDARSAPPFFFLVSVDSRYTTIMALPSTYAATVRHCSCPVDADFSATLLTDKSSNFSKDHIVSNHFGHSRIPLPDR